MHELTIDFHTAARDAGTRMHYQGTAPPDFWKGGQRGHRCPYITVS